MKPMRPAGFYVIGFSALMAFDTLAQFSLKLAAMQALPLEFTPAWLLRIFSLPWVYGAFIGYLGAFFTWMTLLKHAPIGPAFAASHLDVVCVLVLSHGWFGEHIGAAQWLGSLLIVGGIGCLAISESATAAPHAPRPDHGTPRAPEGNAVASR